MGASPGGYSSSGLRRETLRGLNISRHEGGHERRDRMLLRFFRAARRITRMGPCATWAGRYTACPHRGCIIRMRLSIQRHVRCLMKKIRGISGQLFSQLPPYLKKDSASRLHHHARPLNQINFRIGEAKITQAIHPSLQPLRSSISGIRPLGPQARIAHVIRCSSARPCPGASILEQPAITTTHPHSALARTA